VTLAHAWAIATSCCLMKARHCLTMSSETRLSVCSSDAAWAAILLILSRLTVGGFMVKLAGKVRFYFLADADHPGIGGGRVHDFPPYFNPAEIFLDLLLGEVVAHRLSQRAVVYPCGF
jgi:hypothetical protein